MSLPQVLRWLDAPQSDRGIRFGVDHNNWDLWSYARLKQLTYRTAAALVEAGVQQGDVVSIVLRSTPDFVATFFGAMLVAAVPSPLAPTKAFQDRAAYQQHIRGILHACRPSLLITHPDLVEDLAGIAVTHPETRVLAFCDLIAPVDDNVPSPKRALSDLAMLQFTSGSTGQARGVQVPFDALGANVEAIRKWLRWTAHDPFASWLPLHHDMGLVGALLCSIVGGNDLWLLQPEQFVRNPLRYLRCFGVDGARLTVTANFGLDHIVKRIRPSALEGLDFSRWQGVVVGAERINPGSLERFAKMLAPFGFRRTSLLPAYGIAEATLAVTGVSPGEEWTALEVEPASLSLGCKIVPAARQGTTVIGCGCPLQFVSVAILDEEGRELPELTVGEIAVSGRSVARGYINPRHSASSTRFCHGTLHTGDSGFLFQQQLFVLGRLGDSTKVLGQVVFAEDVEIALGEAGIPGNKVAALLGEREGIPTAVMVVEKCREEWHSALRAVATRHLGIKTILVNAPKGTIARTSSGKPKRRLLWRSFIAGTLPGDSVSLPVADSENSGVGPAQTWG